MPPNQSNDQTVLFQRVQLSNRHSFVFSLNVKQFYWTHSREAIKCSNPELEWYWEQWQ